MSQPCSCPICYDDLDITDSSFLPCSCGFPLAMPFLSQKDSRSRWAMPRMLEAVKGSVLLISTFIFLAARVLGLRRRFLFFEDFVHALSLSTFQEILRPNSKLWKLIFATIAMDNLWFYTNQIVHTSKSLSIGQFVLRVSQSYRDHCSTWEWKEQNQSTKWVPPLPEKVSIAFDVAVRASGSTSVAICRSHNREISFIVADHSRSCNPNQGKTMAVFIGAKEAQCKQLKNIIVECDSQRTITALKK